MRRCTTRRRRSRFAGLLGASVAVALAGAGALGPPSAIASAAIAAQAKPPCSDGRDNDNDGYVDYPADAGCDSETATDEAARPQPECADRVDNDGDGQIDNDDDGCLNNDTEGAAPGPPTPRADLPADRLDVVVRTRAGRTDFELTATAPTTIELVVRSGRRSIFTERDQLADEATFDASYRWSCRRAGTLTWRALIDGAGGTRVRRGSFYVPPCGWRYDKVSRYLVTRHLEDHWRDDVYVIRAHCDPQTRETGRGARVWACGAVWTGGHSRVCGARYLVARRSEIRFGRVQFRFWLEERTSEVVCD